MSSTPLFFDRVLETSTTEGTGSYSLAGAVTGYQSFAVVGDSNSCYYCAADVDTNGSPIGDWEVGIGTYASSGTTLSRDVIQASSNSGAEVDWAAGVRRVFLVVSAGFETSLSEVLGLTEGAAQGDILYRSATNWARLGAGTSGHFLKTLGAGANPAWAAIGGGAFYSAAGNPQGVQAGAVGSIYQDTGTGYLYRKCGGGSTAYGWYYWPLNGGQPGGPMSWWCSPSNGAVNPGVASSFGFLSSDVAGGLTGTNISSPTRNYVSGKPYVQAQTGASDGSSTYVTTATASQIRLLEDDCDAWIDMRTGSSVASLRLWFALTAAVIGDTNNIGGSNGAIAIRYSTPSSDPGWIGLANTNNGSNISTTSNLGNIAADTNYRLRIRFVRQGTPTVYFSVDDGTELSLTSNIPATGVGYFLTFGVTAKTASAKVMQFRQMGVTFGS